MRARTTLLAAWQHIFGRRLFRPANALMFHLGLRGLGYLNHQSTAVTGERHFVRHVLPRILATPAPLVVDVGANTGAYAALVLERFPRARIHAIEPHPATFRTLSGNAGNRYQVHNTALSDTEGEAAFYDYPDRPASSHASLHREVFDSCHGQRPATMNVRLTTLDRFAENQGIEAIDFLKIDTEGHECHVLRGARGLIGSGAIRCIQLEFSQLNVLTGCRFADLASMLEGFDFHRLLPHGMTRVGPYNPVTCEIPAFQNLVAVRGEAPLESR